MNLQSIERKKGARLFPPKKTYDEMLQFLESGGAMLVLALLQAKDLAEIEM